MFVVSSRNKKPRPHAEEVAKRPSRSTRARSSSRPAEGHAREASSSFETRPSAAPQDEEASTHRHCRRQINRRPRPSPVRRRARAERARPA
ncbi:hypothetical protein FM996_20650 [Methylosinus sporium]|uniref:Uncharacterized protein n=1 Tax=Methylosinus sporium TaxID=428 RepID=A0A549SCX9_METSR|nr:hypothetical protein FM996_20650 [Methylosinus sporium]